MMKQETDQPWPRLLLEWYAKARRELPWRQDTDPYRIWVSEVMLQQTRVEAVKAYYERWMERFPSLQELAAADEEDVLKQWQGLGYYSRARNLLQGVREVQQRYGGKIPQHKDEIIKLPGIGDYTAGAILSIAYGCAEPAVDGNVLRVFSRLYAIEEEINAAATKGKIRSCLQEMMPQDQPGDFNQALMDLGAGICIPKVPRCPECPLNSCCMAFLEGRQRELPRKAAKKAPRQVVLAVAVLQRADGAFLLQQRPTRGLLAGMWEFPSGEGTDLQEAQSTLKDRLANWGIKWKPKLERQRIIHLFSHRQWEMVVYETVKVQAEETIAPSGVWRTAEQFAEVVWAGPHAKIAQGCTI